MCPPRAEGETPEGRPVGRENQMTVLRIPPFVPKLKNQPRTFPQNEGAPLARRAG